MLNDCLNGCDGHTNQSCPVAFENQGEYGLLGQQMLWTGRQVPRTLASMTLLNRDVPSNRLIVLLERQWAAENGSLLTDSKFVARENRQHPNSGSGELAPSGRGTSTSGPSMMHSVNKVSSPFEGSAAWLHQRMGLRAVSSAGLLTAVGLMPDIARRKLHVTMQVSGHRWHGICCLQYDRTGRILVTGADDT